jgi:intracellular multiplication protein IcmT
MDNPYAANAHWRDAARVTRFFMIDARAAFPALFFFLHMRIWTAITVVIFTTFFAALERYGFTVTVFKRWIRSFLAGKRRISRPWWLYPQFK